MRNDAHSTPLTRSTPAAAGGTGKATPCPTPAQVRALIAPVRQEIVDVLSSAGPCSVATLAALLGRPADALYHHLRRLTKVGLIAATRQKVGRNAFAVYDLGLRPLRLNYDPPVRPVDIARVMAAAQRLTMREFYRALRKRTGVHHGRERTLWGARARGWVTAAQIVRINELLSELLDTVHGGPPAGGTIPISLHFLLTPSPPARRALQKKGPPVKTGEAPESTNRRPRHE